MGFSIYGTSGRTRTGTPKEQQILNLSCLPFHHRGLTTNFYPIIYIMSINIQGFYVKPLCALLKIIAVVVFHKVHHYNTMLPITIPL